MKKLYAISLILFVTLFFIGCSKPIPFKKETPLKNAALVYIFAQKQDTDDENANENSSYIIKIDDKKIKDRLAIDRYIKFNIKPGMIKFSTVRDGIFEKSVKFNAQAGKTYYLKITQYPDNYDFKNMQDKNKALSQIKKTGLNDSVYEDKKDIITKIIQPYQKEQKVKKEVKTQTNISTNNDKMSKIKEAYKMKQDGLITEKEYNKLKREILEEK